MGSRELFATSGQNLTAAGVEAGVRHHLVLSVVGIERLQDSGYFRAKLAQERLIKSSPIPYTLIHATQLFESMRTIPQSTADGDVVRVPSVQCQPIAADDVASAIADVVIAEPANDMIEIAGPDTFLLDEVVRRVLAHVGDAREVIVDPAALYYGAKLSEMSLMPGAGARLGPTRLDW